MSVKVSGEEYRTTVVCIDSYEDRTPKGRFYNPYIPEGKGFDSMIQFLLEMEEILNRMDFPRSYTATRIFATPPERSGIPPCTEIRTGGKATFAVRILFRQNASWQGSVTWLEGKREQSFRSALELILLMDSALSIRQPGRGCE